MPSSVGPRCTVTLVGGTSAILMVLFSDAKIASDRSKPTFLASTSNAATNFTSRTWYWPKLHVHQAGHRGVLVGVLVVLHALHQRGRAVADADNGDPYIRRRRRAVLTHGDVLLLIQLSLWMQLRV